MRIHNNHVHGGAPQPLTGEVVRVNIEGPVFSLHHPGDELFRMHCFIGPRENVPNGAEIAARERCHSPRMNVAVPQARG